MARLARAIQGLKHQCRLPWMAHVKWAMTIEGYFNFFATAASDGRALS